MITGFNTDVEFNGVIYHVQTEDKGLDTPLILSLVYTKGEILAAKRTPYNELIKNGFDEKVLAERLQKQHRLICAAIKQGRVEDLKRMSSARESAPADTAVAEQPVEEFPDAPMPQILDLEALNLEPLMDLPLALVDVNETGFDALPLPPIDVTQHGVRVLRTDIDVPMADFARAEAVPSDALNLILLDDREFRAGDRVTLRIQVTQGFGAKEKDITGAEVVVKVLGAAFRPVILHARTGENGVAVLQIQFPQFKSGRAALLIRAAHGDYEAELRRIVTQG